MESLVIRPDFWKGKRVFLTGHTGFKGSWTALWLSLLEAKVCGYALKPETDPSLFALAGIESDVKSVIADIRDFATLEKSLRDFQPEIVVHMAAQPLVRRSYVEPLETLDTNVMGTANLLQAARSVPSIRAILNVTSDKCYLNREIDHGYREDEAMGGFDPYSVSKGCSELITTAFRNSFFPPNQIEDHGVVVGSARAGNVFGGGDWSEDRLLPDVIRAIAAGETVNIRNPKAVRPWQFVLEPLRGYLLLAQQMVTEGVAFGDGWNFGPAPEDEVPVEVVLSGLQEIFGEELKWSTDTGDHPHEAKLLRLDASKAKEKLGWTPRWDLTRGLQETAKWYKAVIADPSSARTLSLELLDTYTRGTDIDAGTKAPAELH